MIASRRILLDSMIVDRLLDDEGLFDKVLAAIESGRASFVAPHIVRDQLAVTPNEERRRRLLASYDALPKKPVLTAGAVFDVSRFDEARFGDGAGMSGVSIDEVRTRGRGAASDALLAVTAAGEADVLVTEDTDLRKKVERSKATCQIWDANKLRQFVEGEGK